MTMLKPTKQIKITDHTLFNLMQAQPFSEVSDITILKKPTTQHNGIWTTYSIISLLTTPNQLYSFPV